MRVFFSIKLLRFFFIIISVLCSSCAAEQNEFRNRNFLISSARLLKQSYRLVKKKVAWSNLPGWKDDPLIDALSTLRQQCVALSKKEKWGKICERSNYVDELDTVSIRSFFEEHFQLFQLSNFDGSREGIITGYYEPLLRGSMKKEGKFVYPLYHWPDKVLRGTTLPERQVLLASGLLNGNEIVYVDDPIEVFFLQIQGSGRIVLQNGRVIRVGFDGSNNRPYYSIGEWLIKKKAITSGHANMKGIKQWAKDNPSKLTSLLAVNPRFVFFRILPESQLDLFDGPIGTLGVPLTAERSVAVDSSAIPLGTPIFLNTWDALNFKKINRLVFAQDTGSAIRGVVRADYFFGSGDFARDRAERMKQVCKMWLLIPK